MWTHTHIHIYTDPSHCSRLFSPADPPPAPRASEPGTSSPSSSYDAKEESGNVRKDKQVRKMMEEEEERKSGT